MMTRHVLNKGQIVIPKALRDILGIDIGDEIQIELDNNNIIMKKKTNPVDVFREVAGSNQKRITMKGIKEDLESRYQGE